MNKDCHYYGTYYVARMAGFPAQEALQIAWAAETVDECHFDNSKKLIDIASEANVLREFDSSFLLTILNTTDDLYHVSSLNALEENASESSRIMLTAVRSIWMPFHFLPGNWRKAIKYNKLEYYHGSDDSFLSPQNPHYSQNMHDWGLMCRTCSETCWSMLQNAKKQYHEWKDVNNSFALYATGIAMHVLADTWSHEFFVGSPNKLINQVSRSKDAVILNMLSTEELVRFSISNYTYDATGHGPAGSAPDIPYLDDRFVLYHDFLCKCADGAPRMKKRDNQKNFLSGFAQMLLAMRYIRSNPDPEADANAKANILEAYDSAKAELDEVQKLFKDLKFVRNHPTNYPEDDYNEFVFPSLKKSIQKWKDLIKNTYHEDLIDYDLMRTGIYGVINFMQAAKKHRSAVINFIEESLSWKDVFTYRSPFREKPYDADECVRRFFNKLSNGDQKVLPFYVPLKK